MNLAADSSAAAPSSSSRISPSWKVAIVLGGYVLAVVLAVVTVMAYRRFSSPEAQASQGMAAFSESILFLGVLGGVGAFPTAATLYFARPYPRIWTALSRTVLVVAISGILCAAILAFDRSNDLLLAFALMRLLPSPLLFIGLVVAALFTPDRPSRRLMFIGAAMEGATAAYTILHFVLLSTR